MKHTGPANGNGLSAEKLKLLERLLKDAGVELANTNPITPRMRGDQRRHKIMAQMIAEDSFVFPTSFAQQRLWFLDQLEPGSPTYNMPGTIRLKGTLNIDALHKTLNEIVARHESLRTTFSVVDEQPVQVISPSLSIDLPVQDLRHLLPVCELEEKAKLLAIEEAQTSFDLSHGPLLRAKLLRLADDEFMLLITMHHIISDEWSIGIFIRELATLYDGFSSDRSSPLPELSIQYVDFALWQQEWLESGVLEKQLDYWKNQLGGNLPVLELPTDRPRPAVQTAHGAHYIFALPVHLLRTVAALSRGENATTFMTLLAAFQSLLHRYTGQDDIIVGSPIANRNRSETESVIGFFVNTLVLRTDFSGNHTFRELIARVREVALGAYDHQDAPFEKLVEALQPERDRSRPPLFQVAFQLEAATPDPLQLPGLELDVVIVESGTSKFDLTLQLSETKDGFRGSVEYNTDLFDEDSIRRMVGHFQVLLESVVADPNRRVSQLPILTPEEKYQVLFEWNNTQTDHLEGQTLTQLFNAQVERTPNVVAIRFDDRELTYRQLNQQANQLAHYLQSLGVRPETPVGICVDRSFEMVVALMAVLKVGAAYVPLNPANPKERIAFMLEDSRIPVLLTQRQLLKALPENTAKVVCLDSDRDRIAQQPDHNPTNMATPDNLVAVLYTSGSTGQPKGVMVEYKGFLNLCLWYKHHCPVSEESRVLLIIPFTFDAAFKNIIAPLLSGGQLILTSADYYDVARLLDIIEKQQVTVINTTPSLMHPIIELAAIGNYKALSSLEYVSLGGESMAIQKLRHWLNSPYCKCKLIHLYGPSECSDIASCHSVDREQANLLETVPVGKPIDNSRIYLLDKNDNLQPIGIPGELSVAGPTLARGYISRPELTAERFAPDPYGSQGGRIYRTGDLAKWLPEGNLQFIGRIDNQVKIRGIRIELGEIEAALRQHPEIRDVAVIAREDVPGIKRLVAYVVANENHLIASQLRGLAKQKLPDYMVPSAFVMMPALPLTSNGKLDRRALPVPDERSDLDDYVAPRNEMEERMAKIMGELLKVDRVGIQDNFFDLGGHSLLATQFVSRLREAFQVELPLSSLFEVATIAGLSEVIEKAQANASVSRTQGIKRASRESYRAKNLTEPRSF
jgi:amino acid adenylation domain-containing protein